MRSRPGGPMAATAGGRLVMAAVLVTAAAYAAGPGGRAAAGQVPGRGACATASQRSGLSAIAGHGAELYAATLQVPVRPAPARAPEPVGRSTAQDLVPPAADSTSHSAPPRPECPPDSGDGR